MENFEVTVKQNVGTLEYDFKDLKEALSVQMSAYMDLDITEDTIKEARADLSVLRKIRKAAEEKRKEVKRAYMQQYEKFADDVADLLSVIDEPIEMIDGKLKEFESQRVSDKREHIQELYDSRIGEFGEYLPLEAIYNPKWNNATYSEKDIIYDLSEAITKVRSEIDIIKSLHSDIEEDLLKAYKDSGNKLAVAINKNTEYLEIAEKIRNQKPKNADGFTFIISGTDNAAKVREYLDFAEIPYKEV